MKTVINKETGEVLYCTFLECHLAENEMIIDQVAMGNYYDFKNKQFYDKTEPNE